MNKRLHTYREIDTLGKSPIDLVVKVYDGAIGSFMSARGAYEAGDYERGYQDLETAKRFLTHLYTTLDFEQGGAVAGNLGTLYAYMINLTNVIEASKDVHGIDSNLKILHNLRAGWSDLRAQSRSGRNRPESNPAAVPSDSQVNTSA